MKRLLFGPAILSLLLACFALLGEAARAPSRADWPGSKLLNFEVAGRDCWLVVPAQPAPGSPWIWRTEFFGHEPQADQALVKLGWHVAYMDAKDLYGAPKAMALFDQFHQYLIAHYGLAKRAVMEGFSRGGLYAFNYAVAFPERVAAVYLDGPILDIRTMRGHAERTDSGKDEWRNCLAAYGLTEKTVNDFKGNPADRAEPLAKAGIPILLIAGDADTIVPFAENTGALAKRYRDLGGPMLVIVRKGQDHHPHSLANPKPIVDFLVKNARF